jgi:hypothetical protein
MPGRGKRAWQVIVLWLVLMVGTPLPIWAAGEYAWQNGGAHLPIYLAGSQSAMEAQMLGETASPPPHPAGSLLQQFHPSLDLKPGAATLKLPYNMEMHISVLYKSDAAPQEPQHFSNSRLFMKYSMDYRLLPNLQVGLSSYLYRPDEDSLALQRHLADQLGFGPQVKYNLGRWSFLVKSQVESGNRDRPEGLQNWFRVWYAF